MLRTMPRAISLSVRGDFGVGDASAGINVDAADVPPGVGVGLDPVFVEAGAKEQPLRINSRQHMVNMTVCVCACWRMCCLSSRLLLTPTRNYVFECLRRRNPPSCICDWKHILDIIA